MNITAGVLAALLIAVVLWGLTYRASPLRVGLQVGVPNPDCDRFPGVVLYDIGGSQMVQVHDGKRAGRR